MSEQETNKPEEQMEEAAAAAEAAAEAAEAQAAEGADAEEDPLAQLKSENAELKDRLVRALAETENVRRRAEKDKADASAYGVTAFARDILNVSDNLKRALESAPAEIPEALKAFVDGVDMTERELLNILERHGIRKVEPEVGEKFDHQFHQAMFEVPTNEHAPGSVMQVVAAGYVIKDRLLRPAMVGVAKGEVQKVDQEV
ncbi:MULTISPECIES: nucleotide exchange factor GrpE [Kordiimonas]|jgi:molecular chaperone GrpE|uniref:nucleotide exchange factor GrpE n=1 Tax=Kordiimonas TaxID=288021 RepID=UPI00257F1BD3|nr:nucleotide exchange factor GrpE [Kordiimonas sp. UBA4487]